MGINNVTTAFNVFKTNDLTFFKESNLNRNYKPNKAIEESISQKGYNIYNPLIVSYPTRELVDGHHRLRALYQFAEENNYDVTNMPFDITFIIDNRAMPVDEKIKEYNVISRPWVTNDYYDVLVKKEMPAYLAVESARYKMCKRQRSGAYKPVLSVGAAVLAYTHNTISASNQTFKLGYMPIGDVNMVERVAEFILSHNVKKGGKTEFIRALVEWFIVFEPTLTEKERIAFDLHLTEYAEMHEINDHINSWLKVIGRNRISPKKLQEIRTQYKADFIVENRKNNE